jgi:AcrR family transcriptional regulator
MPRNPELNAKMREKSFNNILIAARKLFAEMGYANCKIQDVAVEAGMSTGNIYWYFKGKEGLLQAVLKEGLEAQEAMLETVNGYDGPEDGFIDFFLDEYIKFCKEYSHFILIILSVHIQSGAESIAKFGFDTDELGSDYRKKIGKVLNEVEKKAGFNVSDRDDMPSLVFSLFTGLIVTYGSDWEKIPEDVIKASVLRLLNLK